MKCSCSGEWRRALVDAGLLAVNCCGKKILYIQAVLYDSTRIARPNGDTVPGEEYGGLNCMVTISAEISSHLIMTAMMLWQHMVVTTTYITVTLLADAVLCLLATGG